jgi:hypothetical protein
MVSLQHKLFTEQKFQTIGIGLFEPQIVRTLFLSDNFKLLKKLADQKNIIIFTNYEIGDFLELKIKEIGVNRVKIFKLDDINASFFVKVFSFCLRWSDSSLATLRNLHVERKFKRINLFGYLLRRIFFIVFSHSRLFKKMFRYLLFFSYDVKNVNNSSKIPIPNVDVFFASALTNSESDLPLSIFFKKQLTPVIATLRSWDNLVTKGTLGFQPDFFLSHSDYMTDLAIRVHGIKPSSVVQSVTPSYQKHFFPKIHRNSSSELKITYGCIGPILNPDELNFINWLGEISTEVEACITIVQHPKFEHNLHKINAGNLIFKTFDYLTSTLHDYYRFIAEQNFIIASGTTFALDSMFVNTPLVGLGFEIVEQDYWFSHLRSFDTFPHSKYLFDKLAITKLSNKSDLIEILKDKEVFYDFQSNAYALQMLTGDSEICFNDQIFRLLNNELIT